MKERQAQARDKKNSFPHFPPLCVCVMNIERSNEQHCTFLSKRKILYRKRTVAVTTVPLNHTTTVDLYQTTVPLNHTMIVFKSHNDSPFKSHNDSSFKSHIDGPFKSHNNSPFKSHNDSPFKSHNDSL